MEVAAPLTTTASTHKPSAHHHHHHHSKHRHHHHSQQPASSSVPRGLLLLPAGLDLDGNDPDEALGGQPPGRWLLPGPEMEVLRSRRLVGGLMAAPCASSLVKLYVAVLHLHPIDLTLTFKYMAQEETKVRTARPPPHAPWSLPLKTSEQAGRCCGGAAAAAVGPT